MERTITCRCCEKPVKHRSELIVAGRMFLTFHRACFFGQGGRRWRLRLGYPINHISYWAFFLLLDFVLLATGWFYGFDGTLVTLAIWANVGLLVMRAISWFGFEKKVPE